MRKRGFAPIIIIAVVILFLGIGALVATQVMKKGKILPTPTPTPQPTPIGLDTSSWNLYNNPKASFYFKYPSTYKVGDDGKFETAKFMVTVLDLDKTDKILTYLNYNPSSYSDTADIREAILTGVTTKLTSHLGEEQKSSITLKNFNGVNFIKVAPYSYDGCFCRAVEYITITPDKKIIDIGVAQPVNTGGVESPTPNDKTFKEEYQFDPDEVMTTFKFSPTNQVQQTGEVKEYTNETYHYAIKLSAGYEIPTQQNNNNLDGNEQNLCIRQSGDNLCLITIDVFPNPDKLKLEDYLNQNLKDKIDGPLVKYSFNSYDSLLVKSHPGTDIYIAHKDNIYHINAPTSLNNSDVKVMLSTFRFID